MGKYNELSYAFTNIRFTIRKPNSNKSHSFKNKPQLAFNGKEFFCGGGKWKIKLKDVRDMQLDRGNKFLFIHAHDEKGITRELDCRFRTYCNELQHFYEIIEKKWKKIGGSNVKSVSIQNHRRTSVKRAIGMSKIRESNARSDPSGSKKRKIITSMDRKSSRVSPLGGSKNLNMTKMVNAANTPRRVSPDKREDDDGPYESKEGISETVNLNGSTKKVSPDREELNVGLESLYAKSKQESLVDELYAKPSTDEVVRRTVEQRILLNEKKLSRFFAPKSPGDKLSSSNGSKMSNKSSTSNNTIITFEQAKESNSLSKNDLSSLVGKRTARPSRTRDAPHGLINLGNTCYINSSLQCLFSVPSFMSALSDSVLSQKLQNVFESGKIRNFIPSGYNVREQKDCHEYMITLLDKLGEVEKPACDIFGCTVVNTLSCLGKCGKDRSLREHYNHFSINIDSSTNVQSSLANYFKPTEDILHSTCETCGHGESRQSIRCGKWPSVLLLQLNRFSYDCNGNLANKDCSNMFVPFILETGRRSKDPRKYKLSGMIEHFGKGISSGHYTAKVRRKDTWFNCNDSLIDEIHNIDRSSGFYSVGAYILIYNLED